jgi:hypothetical protein
VQQKQRSLVYVIASKQFTDMTIDLNLTIEELVKDKELSYMDAVLHYAQISEIEPEAMAKMLNQSIKDKIEVEAQNLNMLKKTAKLPI